MDNQKLRSVLRLGENIAVEFKRCGNGGSAFGFAAANQADGCQQR